MEKELNIAAILKDKPSARLWSPIIGECTYSNYYKHCIPYNEETAHLIGTTDEWKGGK